jgi:hypothetical protein
LLMGRVDWPAHRAAVSTLCPHRSPASNESGPARVVSPRRAVSGRAHKRTRSTSHQGGDGPDYATNPRR